jgi:hypothetical protein
MRPAKAKARQRQGSGKSRDMAILSEGGTRQPVNGFQNTAPAGPARMVEGQAASSGLLLLCSLRVASQRCLVVWNDGWNGGRVLTKRRGELADAMLGVRALGRRFVSKPRPSSKWEMR